jgi:hypothetical protein
MPLMMFAMLEIDRQISKRFESLALDYWKRGEGFRAFLNECLNAPNIRPAQDPTFIERTLMHQEEVLAIPDVGPMLKKSIDVLYLAAVSGSWTALECLAADLWVTAVNEEPTLLAQTAICSIEGQEPGELTSKQIPVGLAARHGFDLRKCLGTLLKSKFDFTGISGIRKAYKVFVSNDSFIEQVLSRPELDELEAARHVIVHRAGRVDQEYKRRTKSDLPIGTLLTFDHEQASRFSYISSHAGSGLLAFVNDWFVEKKKTVQ